MRFSKWIASLILAAGCVTTAGAAEWGRDRGDYRAVERLRAEVERDRVRLREDMRHGNRRQIDADRAELRRDQRDLDRLERQLDHSRNSYR